MNTGLVAILITFVMIIAAVKTKRCIECMLTASLTAALFAYKSDFLSLWSVTLQNMFAENTWVILVCLLFGGLVSLLTESKGSFGFSKYLARFCTNQKKTLLTTFIMGILIFIDDYLNVLSIGACMKKISDEKKIPRETLAYILDSTGAPVCVLLPISTWAVFYADLFFEQESVKALGCTTPIEAYIKAIPFCFYPIVTLIIVVLFIYGLVPKLGLMKKAYLRVEKNGAVYSEHSSKLNKNVYNCAETTGKIYDFLIPMTALILLAILSGDILVAVLISLFITFFLYIPRKLMTIDQYLNTLIRGFCDMLPTLIMLVITFVFKEITADMGMNEYLIEKVQPFLLPAIFPAMVFLLGALLAFTTGSDWGMSSIITPIVFPLGATLGSSPILIMAAIISSGTFGSHACFYADATLLASQSSGIDNMEHALSQLPYVIIACIVSIFGFIIAGFLFPYS